MCEGRNPELRPSHLIIDNTLIGIILLPGILSCIPHTPRAEGRTQGSSSTEGHDSH
jgi:hypothetical protein